MIARSTQTSGSAHELERIVAQIRQAWPDVEIVIRADSGFAREEIMAWCEAQSEVYYCLGLAKNSALINELEPAMASARAQWCLTSGVAARMFTEFGYETRTHTWSCSRRTIGKAEITVNGDNPRFIVTNLPADGFVDEEDRTRFTPRRLYEELYCARGNMENMLKQQVLDLEADRLSSHHLASNQLRLWFATFAYLLVERLRSLGLAGTELAQATVGSVRLKLLKVAAQVTVSGRRVYVQ